MIIRGMMSLVPGIKDISENIKAIGIVDRLLEHSRFMIFCNGGDEECFISSADLMTRNIDHRIEVTCPVFDKNIKNELKEIFQIQWNDNVKARRLDSTLSNKFVKPGKKEHRSQLDVYNYLKKIHEK
jgi:polyphosphate kinase